MKKEIVPLWRSKKLLAILIAMTIFIIMIYTTEYESLEILEIAASITAILGLYIAPL